MAMQQRNREAAELLLQAGAMVNAQDHLVCLLTHQWTSFNALHRHVHTVVTDGLLGLYSMSAVCLLAL